MSIRFFIAWASTFVAWMAGSFIVHGVLLGDECPAPEPVSFT